MIPRKVGTNSDVSPVWKNPVVKITASAMRPALTHILMKGIRLNSCFVNEPSEIILGIVLMPQAEMLAATAPNRPKPGINIIEIRRFTTSAAAPEYKYTRVLLTARIMEVMMGLNEKKEFEKTMICRMM